MRSQVGYHRRTEPIVPLAERPELPPGWSWDAACDVVALCRPHWRVSGPRVGGQPLYAWAKMLADDTPQGCANRAWAIWETVSGITREDLERLRDTKGTQGPTQYTLELAPDAPRCAECGRPATKLVDTPLFIGTSESGYFFALEVYRSGKPPYPHTLADWKDLFSDPAYEIRDQHGLLRSAKELLAKIMLGKGERAPLEERGCIAHGETYDLCEI